MIANYQLARNEFSLDMKSCDTQFDQELLKIPHYQHHPEMLPFIGKNYCNKRKRVLLVGESHYLTHAKKNQVSADYIALNWYEKVLHFNNPNNIFYKDFKNYTTRGILKSFIESKKDGSGWIIFSNPIRAYYNEDHVNHFHIHDFAFINFYQRPAFEFGKSINTTEEEKKLNLKEKDNSVACETLQAVINIISPDIIIFFSKKAYNSFVLNDSDITPVRIPHPTCPWWNRATKHNKKGKETFKEILFDAWGQI